MKVWKWNVGVIAAAAAFAMGCGEGPESETTATVETTAVLERIEAGLQLAPAESCEDLESYIKNLYIKQYQNALVTGFGSPMPGGIDDTGFGGEPVANNTGMDVGAPGRGEFAEEGGTATAAPQVPGLDKGYTGTNNQETAVDEGDFVKTDGAHIYILRGTSLLITTAWPADEIEVVAAMDIEGNPRRCLFRMIPSWSFPNCGTRGESTKSWVRPLGNRGHGIWGN